MIGRLAQQIFQIAAANVQLIPLAGHNAFNHLAADFGQLTLQTAHASLPRVGADDFQQRVFRKFQLGLFQAVLFQLTRYQVAQSNLHFFIFSVAVQPHNLHPIPQRFGNVRLHIGGGDKQHLGKVKRHFQIMVAKSVVLGRVQNLQHSAGRVAPKIAGHFVNFIQQEKRIGGAGIFQILHNPAGLAANIGAPVAANFRLIMHAAQGEAHIFAVKRSGNGSRQ